MAEKDQDDGRAFELKRTEKDAGGDKSIDRAADRGSASRPSSATELDPLPSHLRRKYYVVEAGAAEVRIYADRAGEYLVAKAGRDRLVTQVASLEIVRDMVAIAAHRGWKRIELTGAPEFRKEAWLAAAARGIEAKGYEPTELDRAAVAKMRGDFDRDEKTYPFPHNRTGAAPQPMRRSPSGPAGRESANGSNDRNARSHLAVIERVVLAAFPKDPEARKRVLDAAHERMAHHRRRGARFDRAEIVERKASPSREGPSKAAAKAKEPSRVEPRHRDR